MSTPSASNQDGSKASSHAQNAPTPNTNLHLGAFSPAPRSVPSPAAHRGTQSGKSPFTQAQASGGLMAVNHPTGSSTGGGGGHGLGSKHLLGSSPAVSYDSPGGMALNAVMGSIGGVDMGVSLSGLGMSSLGMGGIMGGPSGSELRRADDEERRRRLEEVIRIVGRRPGRISEEGIKRVVNRLGMDIQVAALGGGKRKGDEKRVTIAGRTALLMEVDIKGDHVRGVTIDMEPSSEVWKSASKVLKGDLVATSSVEKINLTLERFERNLETLARLDKLSTADLSCFSVIEGVYKSLQKLFEHEKKAAQAIIGDSAKNVDEKAEREVMCKKSGRPSINEGHRIGLGLEYWMDKRHIYKKAASSEAQNDSSTPAGDRMDIDSPSSPPSHDEGVYSLLIECEFTAPELFPPVRHSDKWISDAVEKPSQPPVDGSQQDAIPPQIDWLEPDPTYIHNEDPQDALNISNAGNPGQKLPSVRFVAKLTPPVVVPLNVAAQLHQSLGHDWQPERFGTYEALALKFGDKDSVPGVGMAEGIKEVKSSRQVIGKDGQEVKHDCSMFIPRNEFSCVLEELPFAHPRQIVQILPILRQYAHLSSLVQSTFLPDPTSQSQLAPPQPQSPSTFPWRRTKQNQPPPLPPLHFDLTVNHLTNTPNLSAVFPLTLPSPDTNGSSMPQNGNALSNNHSVDAGGKDKEEGNGDTDDLLEKLLISSSTLTNSNSTFATSAKALLPKSKSKPNIKTKTKKQDEESIRITLEIQINGHINVLDQNLYPTDEHTDDALVAQEEGGPESSDSPKAKAAKATEGDTEMGALEKEKEKEEDVGKKVRRLERGLDVVGNWGVWIEWVRGDVLNGRKMGKDMEREQEGERMDED